MMLGLTCADEKDPREIYGNIHANIGVRMGSSAREMERTNGPRMHYFAPGQASPEVRSLGPR
jgi:hypothetical protein